MGEDRNDTDSARVRVLVVDAEPMMLRTFEAALALAGYEVLTSGTGREALELAAREQPEVVLLDRHLPDLSGQEVLAALRSDAGTAEPDIGFTLADRMRATLEVEAARRILQAAERLPEDVGEGIEHQEEAATLASLGVPWGQGSLFARPDVIDHFSIQEPTR